METKNSMAGSFDLSTPVTKSLTAAGRPKKGLDPAKRLPVMCQEVPATIALYLIGDIESNGILNRTAEVSYLS